MTDAACNDNQWRCDSGQCIRYLDYCDGYIHCEDRSDEPPVCSKYNYAKGKMSVSCHSFLLSGDIRSNIWTFKLL